MPHNKKLYILMLLVMQCWTTVAKKNIRHFDTQGVPTIDLGRITTDKTEVLIFPQTPDKRLIYTITPTDENSLKREIKILVFPKPVSADERARGAQAYKKSAIWFYRNTKKGNKWKMVDRIFFYLPLNRLHEKNFNFKIKKDGTVIFSPEDELLDLVLEFGKPSYKRIIKNRQPLSKRKPKRKRQNGQKKKK